MLVSVLLAGCSPAPSSTSVAIAPRAYPDAFDGAREVLRSYGFRLAYVDARAGVLESEPKSTAGFATPGDSEQSGLLQEWEALALPAAQLRLSQGVLQAGASRVPKGASPLYCPGEALLLLGTEGREQHACRQETIK